MMLARFTPRATSSSLCLSRRMLTNTLPPSTIPIFTTVASYREWRRKAYDEKKSVGFVATPEHIAEAYLYLVRADYANGTIVTIGELRVLTHEGIFTHNGTDGGAYL